MVPRYRLKSYPLERLGVVETLALRLNGNVAPLKYQNPAREPPAKTDATIVPVKELYLSKCKFAKSQNVRGQTMMT